MADGVKASATGSAASRRDQIMRFRTSERHIHWSVGIPFMICYATALILITVYNPNPTRPFRWVFSWIHRLSGLCLFLIPAFNFVRHRRDARLHLHNIRQVWRWSWDDLRWLCLIGPASVNPKITLPRQGKFNAGEKINFMALTATYPIYLCTGLLIWFAASPYLSWLIHFSLAIVATPLLIGHIFMATVNPDTRPGLWGMITGFVDREWAKHHYHHWFVEHFETPRRVVPPAPAAAPPAPIARPHPRPLPPQPPLPRRDQPVPQAPRIPQRVAPASAIALVRDDAGGHGRPALGPPGVEELSGAAGDSRSATPPGADATTAA